MDIRCASKNKCIFAVLVTNPRRKEHFNNRNGRYGYTRGREPKENAAPYKVDVEIEKLRNELV